MKLYAAAEEMEKVAETARRGAVPKKERVENVLADQKWVADEILYQAAIHPACPVPHLSPADIERLHHWIRTIPEIAVSVNADHKRFPEGWLFRWRWGKGKKQERRVAKAVEGGQVVLVKEEVKVVDTAVKQEPSEGDASEMSDAGSDAEEAPDVKPKGVDFLALVSLYELHRANEPKLMYSQMGSQRQSRSSK